MIWDDPFQYELECLTLVNNEGVGFDIRKAFMGLKLHESITQNFLSGEVSILDGTGFLENAKLFGQETLHLRFCSPYGTSYDDAPQEHRIDKLFRIYHVGEVQRSGQDTLIYNLKFCSPELIQSKRIRINQALKGGMIDTAEKIARDHLGIEVDKKDVTESKSCHIVIPNWSVNYAINWLCKNAQECDEHDALHDSYFFYESANSGFRFGNMSKMIKRESFVASEGIPLFAYTPPLVDKDDTLLGWDFAGTDVEGKEIGIMGMGRRIQGYQIGSIANVLEGTVNGFFASKQITIDPINQQMDEQSYNYHAKFNANKNLDKGADDEPKQFPLVREMPEILHSGSAVEGDESAEPIVSTVSMLKPISSYKDSNVIFNSDTPYAYEESGSNWFTGLSEGNDKGKYMYRQAVDQLLKYNSLNVTLPARTNITAGAMIKLAIPVAKAGEDDPSAENVFHTGTYLITDIQWELALSQCKVNIRCIKDSLMNRIETTTVKLPGMIKDKSLEEEGNV